MSNVRQTVVKLPCVADDTCCGVHYSAWSAFCLQHWSEPRRRILAAK